MIEEQIKELKLIQSRVQERFPIQLLFDTLIAHFNANKSILDSYEKNVSKKPFDMERVKDIFTVDSKNPIGKVFEPYTDEFVKVTEEITPYGIVALNSIGFKMTIYNYLEIIKVCLETRNYLVIYINKENDLLSTVVTLINNILVKTNDFAKIIITTERIQENNFDAVIVVGGKKIAKSLNYKNIPVISLGGTCDLYVDEKLDYKMIQDSVDNGVRILNKEDENELYKKLNIGDNYVSAIMSSSKEKIREFITNCKSSYVLVNMSPLNIDKMNLSPEQLLKRKTTITNLKNKIGE